jgi:phage gp29-like protein
VDARELADVLDVAVNRLGVDVSQSWVRESLGIPAIGDGEAAVTGVAG